MTHPAPHPGTPTPPAGPSRLATIPGPNGAYDYRQPQDEQPSERAHRERFWRSLGKRIRKGARIR